ncbi:MAG: AarF/UbiB family protein [Acidimicrobiales bacterium]
MQPWSLAKRPPKWIGRVPELSNATCVPSRLTRAPKLPPVGRAITVVRVLEAREVGVWALRERGTSACACQDLASHPQGCRTAQAPPTSSWRKIISSGEGVFPAELVAECKCATRCRASPYDEVVAIVEQQLGRPMHELFRSFRPEPLAAASIAQVQPVLKSGEPVVVKVQRPGIDGNC